MTNKIDPYSHKCPLFTELVMSSGNEQESTNY